MLQQIDSPKPDLGPPYDYPDTTISDFDITGGVNYTSERAEVADFDENQTRDRLAVFGAVKYLSPNHMLSGVFSMREEWVDSDITPIIPSLGLQVKLRPSLKLNSHVSRNYRVPTLNDLYWSGANARGNPDLDPELSWSEEIGIVYNPCFGNGTSNGKVNMGFTVFSSQVDDWILWVPVTVDTWSPWNIKKVWSRGIESIIGSEYQVGKVELELIFRYSYTKVTNEKIDDGGNQSELGKQLIYTPYHEGSITGEILWKYWNFNAVFNYTGKQYTDGGNTEVFSLDPYGVFNISLNRNFRFHSLNGHVLLQANNLLNRQYQNRVGYPMPGRNYNIGIQLLFNKNT